VVMRDGRIAQAGTPLEVWQHPASAFVARFLGFDNLVDATVTGTAADTAWGKVPVSEGSPQGECELLVRPGGVRIGRTEDGLRCTVGVRTFRGHHVTVALHPGDGPALEAECALRDTPEEGAVVGVTFDPAETVVLPPA